MNFFAQLLKATNIPQTNADQAHLNNLFNIVFATVGALAFLMLVIAAFRYVTSQGEPDKLAGARRQITYSIIGLVVIALAATIVNYVVSST